MCTFSKELPSASSGVLRTQKLKTHLLRTQSSKVLHLKPGIGQNISCMLQLLPGIFSGTNFYRPGAFTCIFFLQNLSGVFPVLAVAVANTGSCVFPQNKKPTLPVVPDD